MAAGGLVLSLPAEASILGHVHHPAEPLTGTGAPPDHGPSFELIRGDCRDVLPLLPSVTDPPYGIGIADWEQDVPGTDVWTKVLRVLKPGAALVAFGARRTYHRLASNVAEAGFVVKDMASWVYKTGRPPSRQHLRPAHEPICRLGLREPRCESYVR